MPSERPSCYVLELSVQPGGSRWAETHAYPNPGHLRLIAEQFCKNDGNSAAYHAIWYGARLGIWVVQNGVAVKFVDLQPQITVHPVGGEALRLDEEAKVAAFAKKMEEANDGFASADSARLELFWDAVETQLPKLDSPVLKPGQELPVEFASGVDHKETYVDMGVSFGSYDHELGGEVEVLFDVSDVGEP